MPQITSDLILTWVLIGLTVSLLTKLFVPGSDLRGWFGTFFVGIVGSVVGGLIVYALRFENEVSDASAWVLSMISAAVALLVYYRVGAESGLDRIT
jgi:uncharacterized membrane protein YeaQ/YmgE (transglycosylase-associated protein family)